MKRKSVLLFLLLSLNCGQNNAARDETPQILTNILTLELAISDETVTNEQYLLANPKSIAVNSNDDIFILDEDRIKVFNSDGTEKIIVGGQGQGPGEFERSSWIDIGPTGLIAVYDAKGINMFLSDVDYSRTIPVRSNSSLDNLPADVNTKVYHSSRLTYLHETRWIADFTSFEQGGERLQFRSLLYHDGSESKNILTYQNKSMEKSGALNAPFIHRGLLNWDIYDKKKLVYWYPKYNEIKSDETTLYSLNILDLDTFIENKIEKEYLPVLLPDSEKSKWDDMMSRAGLRGDGIEEAVKNIAQRLRSEKYFAPLKKLLVDKNLLFVFTYAENEKGELLADIFDVEKESYIRSAYFSVEPNLIKNGFAYFLKMGKDVLPSLEKYKVDERIYSR